MHLVGAAVRIIGVAAVWAWLLGAQHPDPELLAAIDQIKAIDNHAHPGKVLAPGEHDIEIDALMSSAAPNFENYPAPVRLRPDYPENLDAWHVLFGYPYRDFARPHLDELVGTKERIMRERGDDYANWVLDQLGIETMLANRIALGRGLRPPRFRWVSFVDALLFPLNNDAAKAKNSDLKGFYEDEEKLLRRYLSESGLATIPVRFDEYLTRVVTGTLERQRSQGAVAIKFEAAYLRSLDFEPASNRDAAAVFEKYALGGQAPSAAYKTLQDYLFRYMAREAGRLGMPVHLHVTGGGVGTYYYSPGGNPLLLTSAITDPALHKTTFVFIHGGEPWIKETRILFEKPNVYADFSAQTFLVFPHELADTIRAWIEQYPERVLFGTDTSPGTPEFGWEEQGWITTRTARRALAIALTGMLEDQEITRDRALELARMVLHDNAAKLYGFSGIAGPRTDSNSGK
jgi:hypothetical protein